MVPDVVADGLDVLFVGYNPGRESERRGHHFAGRGNLFWALLYEAGLTDRRLEPAEDHWLLYWRLGITNLVSRMTPGSADLARAEMEEGGALLRERVGQLKPRVVACLGKDVYRYYRPAARRPTALTWGLQPEPLTDEVIEVVLPNPSARSTVPYGLRLRYFRELKGIVRWGISDHT